MEGLPPKEVAGSTEGVDQNQTAELLVLRAVTPPREDEGSSINKRQKRQRRPWPPRSPPLSDDEDGQLVCDIVIRKGRLEGARRSKHAGEEEDTGIQDEWEDSDADYLAEEQDEGAEESGEGHSSPHSKQQSESKGVQKGGKRTRQKGINWRPVCVLKSEDAFQTWKMENERENTPARWAKKRSSETKTGMKRDYHCNVIGCKAELMVRYPNHSEEVEVFHNGQDHAHPEDPKKWGLPFATKQEVERLWKSGLRKPRLIQAELERKGFAGFKRNQLTNFLFRLKKMNRLAEPQLSVGELNEWCNQHSITQPAAALSEDVDRVYVIDHNINVKTRQFHFVMSSKRLLKFAAQASVINVDAFHKLKWFDSSVLFIGVSDVCGQFFPVFFAAMSAETKDSYARILKVLKQCVEAATGSEFRPECVIGHGCPDLTGAVKEVFPSAVRRVCCLGMRRQVAAALKQEDKEARSIFEEDINALRLSCDEEEFGVGARLMLQKWRDLRPASKFPEYFEDEHIKLNSGWYEGFHVMSHSTNKSLASAVNAVKQRHTLRERLPIERFLALATELVVEWSIGVSEAGDLPQRVEPDKVLLTDTCRLQNLQKTMVELHSAIYIPAGDRSAATVDEVELYERKMKGEAESFGDFIDARMSLWKVEDTGDKSDLAHMRCTCPKFLTCKLCEHVLAIGSAYGLFTMPQSVWDALADTPDGRRRRGRPGKKKLDDLEPITLDPSAMACYIEERMDLE